MSAFVDTSVWFAAAAKRDAQNERAKSISKASEASWCIEVWLPSLAGL